MSIYQFAKCFQQHRFVFHLPKSISLISKNTLIRFGVIANDVFISILVVCKPKLPVTSKWLICKIIDWPHAFVHIHIHDIADTLTETAVETVPKGGIWQIFTFWSGCLLDAAEAFRFNSRYMCHKNVFIALRYWICVWVLHWCFQMQIQFQSATSASISLKFELYTFAEAPHSK